MLNAIEKATNKKIERMELPSTQSINDRRIEQFKQSITDTLANEDLSFFTELVEQYQQAHDVPLLELSSALARLVQGESPLLLQNKPTPKASKDWDREGRGEGRREERRPRRERSEGRGQGSDRSRPPRREGPMEEGMERFRIEVGHKHEVMPGNIVGAIANEAGIDAKHIGRITIHDDHSTVDLPADMPSEIFNGLKKVWVSGQALNISRPEKKESFSKSDRPAFDKSGADKTSKRKPKSKTKVKPNAKAKARMKEAAEAKKNAGKRSKKKVRKKSPE